MSSSNCSLLTCYRFLKRQVRWSDMLISFRIFHSLLWWILTSCVLRIILPLPTTEKFFKGWIWIWIRLKFFNQKARSLKIQGNLNLVCIFTYISHLYLSYFFYLKPMASQNMYIDLEEGGTMNFEWEKGFFCCCCFTNLLLKFIIFFNFESR